MSDPEFDPRPTGTRCRRCLGSGFLTVLPDYADTQYPETLDLTTLSDAERAVVDFQRHMLRSAAANSVYPCRECRPEQFFRWLGGHWQPDHDKSACDECKAAGLPRSRRPVTTVERKDLG